MLLPILAAASLLALSVPARGESFRERWGLGLEADLEFAHERQGGESASEWTFDELGLRAGREWWEAEAAIKYEPDGRGLIVEEGALKLGATEGFPAFVKAGRTALPFGESETRFGEDPLAVALAEQFDDTAVLGFESERWELAAGAFRTELSSHDFGASASVRFAADEAWAIGFSCTSELGESAELREFRRERSEDSAAPAVARDAVAGYGASLALDVEAWAALIEFVTAADAFDAGVLAAESRRPRAWNTEVTFRPAESWELTARYEASRELPEAPHSQAGIAAAFTVSELVTLSAEYLRGNFDAGVPDRDLFGAKVAFEY